MKRLRFLLLVVLLGGTRGALFASPTPTGPVPDEDAFLLDTLWSDVRSLPHRDDEKVGIALGGGGARGLAHIGILKVLDEEDVPVDMIAGTSVGALIGALYAAGVSTMDMEQMSAEIGWSSLTNYSRYSLFRLLLLENPLSTRNMEVYLNKHIHDIRFDQLKTPFVCSATDLQTGERVVFREGPVAPAARASATIPGLFEPVEFRHRYLVDGGLVDNIPTDLVIQMGAKHVIAVDVTADFSQFQPKNISSTLVQAIYIQSESLSKDELSHADIIIRPDMGDISPIDLTRSAECINAGALAARRAMPRIKEFLIDQDFSRLLSWRSEHS